MTYDARWTVDEGWNGITFSFSRRREETAQHPWRKEICFRIGKTYWLSEQASNRNTWCDCGGVQGTEYPMHMKLLNLRN